MSWIDSLQRMVFSPLDKSQLGESEVIKFIFENIGVTNRFFLDIGAGFYGKGEMSNTNQLLSEGWQGLKIDANNNNDPKILKLYVTPDNIVPFLKEHNVPYGFDLLSIDIDSFDLDIMEKVVPAYHPRVICTEFNGTLDPDSSIKLKYEPGYTWDQTNKYGYSFGAGVKFCNNYGYKIIHNQKNQNLFLVRADEIKETPTVTATKATYHPINPNAQWDQY